jgi:hypothetical protein
MSLLLRIDWLTQQSIFFCLEIGQNILKN